MSTRAEIPEQVVAAKPARGRGHAPGLGWLAWLGRFGRRKPLGALGGVIVLALLLMAAFAEQIGRASCRERV